MTTTMNGWGLIGTGDIAEDRILPGINSFASNKLIAVVSRDQARADAFAKKFGARHAYTSYDDMLRNPAVTVVAIETPNALHAGQAIAAARAGKHVFCDKPLATTVADAERVLEECEKAGVKLGVNFQCRFMPCFIESKRIIDSGEIGEVLLVELEASAGARPGGTLARWRVDPAMAGLGTSITVGVHVYDILRYMLSSEIVTVTAFFDSPRGVMEQAALSVFRFANGILAQVNVNEKTPNPHNDFVIYGTKGRITGRGLTRSRFSGELQVLTGRGENCRMEFPSVNAHALNVAAFSQGLLEGRAISPSGIDGLRSVQLTDAMARSAWDGVHVSLSYS
ncbi:MAG: Gfo/Idh/MocA family oxidoreductase [Betaproteobacteria bacterium]|nr:Gfo/Idh/MocA family oxidoreductase [Betaproteobacteria bacterium]